MRSVGTMVKARVVMEELSEGKRLVRMRPEKPKFRVLLSVDGGGVRGIVPAVVLKGFEKAVKVVAQEMSKEARDMDLADMEVDIKDYFDVVAGNSAGSILALYLASGGGKKELYASGGPLEGIRPGSAQGAITLVSEMVKEIFKASAFSTSRIPGLGRLSGLLYSKYGNKGLVSVMDKIFGDITLEDLVMNTYVPSYELNNARPVGFYCRQGSNGDRNAAGYMYPKDIKPRGLATGVAVDHSHPQLFEQRLANLPAKVVAQASSSAPVFFSATNYKQAGLGEMLGFDGEEAKWVDGGVVSNNPTMQGLAFMSARYATGNHRELLKADKMAVLSLGTGGRRTPPSVNNRKQGIAWWGADLISVLMDSHTEVNHRIIDAMFDGSMFSKATEYDRYVRINRIVYKGDPDYDVVGALDSVDKVDQLIEFGEGLVTEFWEDMLTFVRSVLLASD